MGNKEDYFLEDLFTAVQNVLVWIKYSQLLF